jgi:uncharacterized protein YlbG (UPF0298 family)
MSFANNAGTVLSNAGAGAGAGAALGPIGAAAGAGIGIIAGAFQAWANSEDEKRRQKILEEASKQLHISQDNLESMFNQYYKDNNSIGNQEDVEQYRNLVEDYDPNEFVYDFDEFNYDKGVDDFYAPNKQAIIDKTSDQLQHTAAGAGIGRGTGAANQIATGVAEKNESLYRDALDAMNKDRQFAYQIWNSNIQNQQNRLNQLKNVRDTQISMYGNLADDFQEWNQNKLQQQMALEQNKANQNLQLSLASI